MSFFQGEEGLEEYIQELCSLVGLVYKAIDPECESASDGFCSKCPHGVKADEEDRQYFRHEGKTLDWLRLAVLEKLERDGIPIPKGWDTTGKEIIDAKGN